MNDRLKFSYGLTLNVGNYESVRIDVGFERDLLEGQDRAEVLAKMREYVVKEVQTQAAQERREKR